MAIYRIYPEKDSSIYSQTPISNTGRDEILELGGYRDQSGIPRATRFLIQFNDNEISTVVDSLIRSNPISASIKLFLAEASEIPADFSISCFPLSQSWGEGIGQFRDTPIDTSGVSWRNTLAGQSTPWNVTSYNANSTGSYTPGQAGGGCWIYSYNGTNLSSSVNLSSVNDLDLSIDVSNAINTFYSGSLPNYGFLFKLNESSEFNTTSSVLLKYFSYDSSTIYPPYLEFKWEDSSYNTGSLNVLSSANSTISISNLKEKYYNSEKIKFRLSCRPKYPVRSFTTGSVYLTKHALPSSSFWGLKDEYTDEMIIDFDKYTKISCDELGSYFTLYPNTLQPERYYRLLIKTELDGSDLIVDDKNIFKLVRNG